MNVLAAGNQKFEAAGALKLKDKIYSGNVPWIYMMDADECTNLLGIDVFKIPY